MKQSLGRVGALLGALLFLVTSAGLTIFVVWQATHQDNSASTADINNAANANSQQSCQDTQAEPTLPKPDVYKPTVPVKTLQITDLKTGTGPAAKAGDCLVVKYYGTLASNGTMFDENFTKPTAFAFTLDQGQVIQGWDQGLAGMKAGGVRRLAIPSAFAYGAQSPSSAIPANSDLVFVVNLLRIQPLR